MNKMFIPTGSEDQQRKVTSSSSGLGPWPSLSSESEGLPMELELHDPELMQEGVLRKMAVIKRSQVPENS
jgi:hypothetical protein